MVFSCNLVRKFTYTFNDHGCKNANTSKIHMLKMQKNPTLLSHLLGIIRSCRDQMPSTKNVIWYRCRVVSVSCGIGVVWYQCRVVSVSSGVVWCLAVWMCYQVIVIISSSTLAFISIILGYRPLIVFIPTETTIDINDMTS